MKNSPWENRVQAALTGHVSCDNIRSVFHKESKHGWASRPALQPEDDWSIPWLYLEGTKNPVTTQSAKAAEYIQANLPKSSVFHSLD